MTQPISEHAKKAAEWGQVNGYGFVATELLATFAQHVIDAATADKDELHRMQLVAIMTATLQNTPSTIVDRIDRDHPYSTVAYLDVCRTIDREMALINSAAAKDARIKELTKDVNDLNNVLRSAGWGQGEIDSAASIQDEYEAKIKELEERLRVADEAFQFHHARTEGNNATYQAICAEHSELEREVIGCPICLANDRDHFMKRGMGLEKRLEATQTALDARVFDELGTIATQNKRIAELEAQLKSAIEACAYSDNRWIQATPNQDKRIEELEVTLSEYRNGVASMAYVREKQDKRIETMTKILNSGIRHSATCQPYHIPQGGDPDCPACKWEEMKGTA